MTEACKLAVIGAGPAGMAAAVAAAEHGVDVALFDEQEAPGGQIYRAVERADAERFRILGPHYGEGRDLVSAFRASGARYHPGSTIWLIKPDLTLGVAAGEVLRYVQTKRILIATGALERPWPFPGWTLPGVMTAGAGQVMLKSAGAVPAGRVVLAGSGPLLLLVACQYLRAGVAIEAFLDFTRPGDYVRAAPHLPGALLAGAYLLEGLAMRRELAAARVAVHGGGGELAAEGRGKLEAVRFRAGGRLREIAADLLLVHEGVVPHTNMTLSIRADHRWVSRQACWRPVTDPWGNTSVAGVQVAGDGAGIDGARAAALSGHLAGLDVARALGRITTSERDRAAQASRKGLRRERRVRPFLETLFQPPPRHIPTLSDDVLVCRCEEVTAGRIRQAIGAGCHGANEVKYFTRAGMGPCQGRQCALTVSRLIADTASLPMEAVGTYRVRPPVKPVSMGQLAALAPEPDIR